MVTLNTEDRELLARVLEHQPELGRKGNPRLKPLSMYQTELKNMKQIAEVVKRISDGGRSSDNVDNAKRYDNTLRNIGLWSNVDPSGSIGEAGEKLLFLAQSNDGATDFWQKNSRAGDKIFLEYQVKRLIGPDEECKQVSGAWREAFYNVQEVLDHISETDARLALAQPDLKEIEALQYMNSVGTEPWRYSRLASPEKRRVQDLILSFQSSASGEPKIDGGFLTPAAIGYATAIRRLQRDVRFRVAGFVEAFLDTRAAMGSRFPRLAPDYTIRLPSDNAGVRGGNRLNQETSAATRSALPLPIQVIISGCPGSGKSALAERSASGATVIRTQFHSETTNVAFVGGYRPVPVYEHAPNIVEVSGAAFERGRPLIDYRFVPGPALTAVAAAASNPDHNVVLLIEELNRGNAAAAFGELFQLLDRADDDSSRYGVTLGPEAEGWLRAQGILQVGQMLSFPANLYIWATMNSGDQGVFPLDTAFRRRWAYRYLGYSERCAYPIADQVLRFAGRNLAWDPLRRALNQKLKLKQIVEDRLIGPYFLTRSQLRDPVEFLSKLLLYLWDDVLRFQQQEFFRADSFAGVTNDWMNGEGNPFLDSVLDVDGLLWEGEREAPAAESAQSNDGSSGGAAESLIIETLSSAGERGDAH